jgi:hypothetical protein
MVVVGVVTIFQGDKICRTYRCGGGGKNFHIGVILFRTGTFLLVTQKYGF